MYRRISPCTFELSNKTKKIMKTLLITIAIIWNMFISNNSNAQSSIINNVDFTVNGTEECPIFNWDNKKEVNTSYYSIEYSYDNMNFNIIACIKAVGNSNFKTNYMYSNLCKKPESTTYFRVVLVLMGGERIVSSAKSIIGVDTTINQNVIAKALK